MQGAISDLFLLSYPNCSANALKWRVRVEGSRRMTDNNSMSREVLGFDPEVLSQRYASERNKRTRKDAEEQFG